jgi:tetratricopeptide (TPR) repeat protein
LDEPMSELDEQTESYDLDELGLDELLYYASLFLQQGEAAEAELVLRHAEERFPDDGDVQLGLGDILLAIESPEAEAQVRRAAALAADDAGRLTRAASQLFVIGDLEASRDLVAAAVRVMPEEFEYSAALAHLIGMLAEAANDVETAEQMFQTAYEGAPEHEDYGYSLARFLADRGESERALEVVEQSLTFHPEEEWLLGLRAELIEAAPEA